ncbi:phosphoribulokinase [Leptonema illini]|uniref:Phosphoribulokinase n=1 Tax=Leptonema illini DSM 21528 TaxID=929563 RepID=H2CI15_9LEPT|nr:phosphoribulokinase [Leptonema illini]EHQ08038.1 phosphoribulokinase/uridine kinase [Leptonema illini DSM 21528]
MSVKYPVIAVTGSSGAGTSTVRVAFEHMFRRLKINAITVEGDSFHRYDRKEFKSVVAESYDNGQCRPPSHFGPEGNHFDKIASLFQEFGQSGQGHVRHYIHSEEEAEQYGTAPGTFTEFEPIPEGTEVLFYEGLHGGVVHGDVDAASHVDLLVGVVPIVNLEWIQKIHRDVGQRGYTAEAATETILRRMYDYVHYITPQFSLTNVNFQRVPTVDTSNPFIARDIPTPDESFVVIRFRYPKRIDFPYLLQMIQGAFMSRPNTICVPGGKFGMALEIILQPKIERIYEASLQARGVK